MQPDQLDLPSFCLDYQTQLFEHVGADTAGPLYAKANKTYTLLFIDLVCHAINLELLSNMTTKELSLAFRCFMACRRSLVLVILDNAPQFALLNVVLSAAVRGPFQWKFIPLAGRHL